MFLWFVTFVLTLRWFCYGVAYREERLLKEWEDEKAAEAKKVASQGGDADDGTRATLPPPSAAYISD